MLPTPKISVILGNLRYDTHVSALQVSHSLLPAVNTTRILFPATVTINAELNEQAEVTIDTGEGALKVLNGKIQSIEYHPYQTIVTLCDGSYDLSQYHPNETFEKQNSAAIAQSLAADVNLSVDNNDIDLSIPLYAAHQKRTAAEHIANLAKLSDGFALVNGDGKLSIKNWSEGPADVAIKHGRDLIDFNFSKRRSAPVIAPIGNGPSGSADAPDALRMANSQLPESVPEPGQDIIWQPHLMLRTPSAVQTAQTGLARERNQQSGQAHLVALLRPDFTPGMVLEIQDIPAVNVADKWVLIHVTHEIAQNKYARTVIKARESTSAGNLLNSLAGALGALL